MGDDLKVFNLGEAGVDLVSSPLHAKDGSLARAQNAEFFIDQGKGAIRQRPPLRRLIASAVPQAIGGFLPIALADPYVYSVYANGGTSNAWIVSTDGGATWADASSVIISLNNAGRAINVFSTDPSAPSNVWTINGQIVQSQRKAYWVRDPSAPLTVPGAGADPTITGIMAFDGTREYELVHTGARIPVGLFAFDGSLYYFMTVNDTYPSSYGCYRVDLVTSEVTLAPMALIGDDAPTGTQYREVPIFGVSHLGRVWMLTGFKNAGANTRKARVLSAHPEDTAWTEERVAAANQQTYVSAAVFQGNLYVSTLAVLGTAAIIEKRTPAGTWSTARTGGITIGSNIFYGLTVFENALYAIYGGYTGGATVEVHKYDGSAWSIDLSYTAGNSFGFTSLPWGLRVIGQTMYLLAGQQATSLSYTGYRKNSGTWTAMTAAQGMTAKSLVMGV